MAKASRPLVDLHDPVLARNVLEALRLKCDGKPAAPETVWREREVLVNALYYASRRRIVTTGKVTLERVYTVTDLEADQADAQEIAHRVRQHRGIENKIHHVRDTAWSEDASRVRTGTRTQSPGRPTQPRHRRPSPHRTQQHRRRPARR